MLDMLDLGGVVRGHVGTLRSFRTGKIRPSQIVLFFGVPAVVATGLVLLDLRISAINGLLVTALAIMAGLLFNLLILIYEAATRDADMSGRRNALRADLLAETHKNVAFAVLLAIAAILPALLGAVIDRSNSEVLSLAVRDALGIVFSFLAFYLMAAFILTLLMILKRVRVLIEEELKDRRGTGGGQRAA